MTGENRYRKEAVYLVGDSVYLYLKQSSGLDAIAYETYDRKTGGIQRKGVIPSARMESDPIRCRMACARILAQEKLGLKDARAGEVAVSTLDSLKDAKITYRREHIGTLNDYSISFVNTRGKVLFRLKDGGLSNFIIRIGHLFPGVKMWAKIVYEWGISYIRIQNLQNSWKSGAAVCVLNQKSSPTGQHGALARRNTRNFC